jgi:hypothetical protein
MLSFFSWASPSSSVLIADKTTDSLPHILSSPEQWIEAYRQKMVEMIVAENEYMEKSVSRIFITHENVRYELEIFHQREEIDLYCLSEKKEEGRRLDGAITIKIPRPQENEALLQRLGEPFFPSTTMRQWVIVSPEFQESRNQFMLAKEKYMEMRKQFLSFFS